MIMNPFEQSPDEAKEEGWHAYHQGKSRTDDNPFDPKTEALLFNVWNDGWLEAARQSKYEE